MRRFEVTLDVPRLGVVKHVIRAVSLEEAKERALAAHPKGHIVAFGELAS